MSSRLLKRVERMLADPLEVVPTRYGRMVACEELQDHKYIVVIFEEAGEDLTVITAVKVDREGARRYGFARV